MNLIISFSTPEGDVKGVAPVKLMSMKELVATTNKNRLIKDATP